MEQSCPWDNLSPLHMEMDMDLSQMYYDEEFLGTTVATERSSDKSPELLPPSSSRTCIISFDNSTIIPLPAVMSKPPVHHFSTKKMNSKNQNSKPETINTTDLGEKENLRSKPRGQVHTMAERKRRLELAHKFTELKATIPCMKKNDKISIVEGAINYVEKLQKQVNELEQKNIRDKELIPYVKVKVLEKDILIYINCEKENGIELKIFGMLQNLHLFVTSTSILPFGNSTLGITIIAQMGDAYKMTMMELVENLRQLLLNGANI